MQLVCSGLKASYQPDQQLYLLPVRMLQWLLLMRG